MNEQLDCKSMEIEQTIYKKQVAKVDGDADGNADGVTATQSIKELAPYKATSARLYNWNVYGLGYQDEEQKKVQERTRLYTQSQASSRTPD